MRLRFILFFAIAVFFFSSCRKPEDGAGEKGYIYIQKSTPMGNWSLRMPEGPYAFTDRIVLEFELDFDDDGSLSGIMPVADVWGDFRVRHLIRKGSSFKAEIIPRKSGESRLIIALTNPSNQKDGADIRTLPYFILDPERQLFIESVMEEGEQDAAGLLPETENNGNTAWIVLSFCLLSALGLALFFLQRRNRFKKDPVPASSGLTHFLENQKTLEDLEGSYDQITGIYRTIFHLLLEELMKIHPALKGKGYGPAELIEVLEEPSSLNQWNLRSLYPLLGRMEQLFFNRDCPLPGEAEYKEDRNLLLAWTELSKEEHREI